MVTFGIYFISIVSHDFLASSPLELFTRQGACRKPVNVQTSLWPTRCLISILFTLFFLVVHLDPMGTPLCCHLFIEHAVSVGPVEYGAIFLTRSDERHPPKILLCLVSWHQRTLIGVQLASMPATNDTFWGLGEVVRFLYRLRKLLYGINSTYSSLNI